MSYLKSLLFFLKRDSGTTKYLSNTSWLLGARAIQMLVAFFIGAWLARYLGVEQFGIYNYVISYVGIFSALSSLGLGTIIVRDMLHKKFSEHLILGTGLFLRFVGSALACLLIVCISYATGESKEIQFFLILASIQPIVKSFEVLSFYFQAKVQSKYTVIAQVISLLLISCIKIYFILNHYSIEYFFYLMALDSAIVGMVMFIEYKNLKQELFSWRVNKNVAHDLLKDSWPLIFSGMLTTVYLKIDQVMIGNMLDKSAVGYYASAVKISEAWLAIPWIISGSFYPALVNAYKSNPMLFSLRLKQLYIILIVSALIVIFPILFFADFVILTIFGNAYLPASATLQLHIFSSLFIFLGTVNNRWLILENLQKLWMFNTAIGALLNIGLNLFFIPLYGIYGAALATLISYAFAYHFAYFIHRKTRKMFYLQNRMILSAILVLPSIKLLKLNSSSTKPNS